ncbi:MAG: molybdenum transporter, periplasmic molybdate-binding protein [Acidimicrobiales bacterium]|nr:molybdenum transporter, periplasmic molybdate-binding protein [Acidimicrobiales bacterium]
MRRLMLAAVLVLVVAVGCGTTDGTATTGAARPTVFGAASLTEAFTDLGGATFTFAGSSALVTQIQQGAPADVFASADETNMQKLVDAGLVETPKVFAHNTLEIVTGSGNPKRITGLADLDRAGLIVVLADPSVPVGRYSQQVLTKAGVTVKPRSLELDVKAALTKVTTGEADASIVYASDVAAAGNDATGVEIPNDQNVTATYPIAVVKATAHRTSAEAFVQKVLSTRGQAALQRRGFLPA